MGAIGCGKDRSGGGRAPQATLASESSHDAATISAIENAIGGNSPFGPTIENATRPLGSPPSGLPEMVWIPGGEFSMGAIDPDSRRGPGCGDPTTDAQPVHRVYVDGFWMDSTEVTNEAFGEFVRATGYVTVAVRAPSA